MGEGWPQTEHSGSRLWMRAGLETEHSGSGLWVRAGLRLNTRGVGCG